MSVIVISMGCMPLLVAFYCRIPAVQLHTTGAPMAASVEDFNKAKVQLGTLKDDPGNEVKLKIYALFKQVSQLFRQSFNLK